jgi:beta-glucosidase-like glycosyl hydrolase
MHKALEMETDRKEAEAARLAAEASRQLQAQLQAQLQQRASEDATAAQGFAKKREKTARESQAITQRLQLLQNNPQTLPAGNPPAHQVDWTTFSPHLNHTSILPGRTATNKQGLRSL